MAAYGFAESNWVGALDYQWQVLRSLGGLTCWRAWRIIMMDEDVREKLNGLGNFCSGSIPLYMSPSCMTFHPWADCVRVD